LCLVAEVSIVPAVNTTSTSKYPLVCFDLDGTLVDKTVYIWQTLHDHFRTDASRRVAARDAFFAGRITYEAWFDNDIDLLRAAGADRASMTALIRSLPVMPGAPETLDTLRRGGAKVAVVSGSVDLVVETLFPEQRFDGLLINRLWFADDGRLAGGEPTQYDMDRKADGLRSLARRFGVRERDVAFVGDNANDLAIARAAGFAVAFNCKSLELAAVADVVVAEHDLRAVLPFLLNGAP
jgi:phosphoserine phosphatase